MAADQRYCLECGERRAVMSSVLLGGPPLRSESETGASTSPPLRPPDSAIASSGGDDRVRGSGLSVIAGVGVLLLAMGVGVLIGRSSASTKTPAPQVITVGSVGSAGTGSGSGSEASTASFTSDWPSGTSGYTVQLQTLPQSGTQVNVVEAAKTAASAKGAKSVGALKSEEFSSLGGTNYVIYSGVYHKRSEAQDALESLKKSFSGATVIKVSNGGEGSGSSSSDSSTPSEQGGTSHHSGVGYSLGKPAPPTVVKKESTKKGQSYEQESKSLPNVISTG
jgi:SPOR domain